MMTSTTRPTRIALEIYGAGSHRAVMTAAPECTPTHWVSLLSGDEVALDDPTVVRIRMPDLRAAQKATENLHRSVDDTDSSPTVLLDVEVLIAEDSRTARAELARLDALLPSPQASSTIRYLGTPDGLAGLITDIAAVKVADGVTLIPLLTAGTEQLIFERVAPALAAQCEPRERRISS